MSKESDRNNYLIRLGVLPAPPAVSIWGQQTVRIGDIEVTQVTATPRRLRARWTMELDQERRFLNELVNPQPMEGFVWSTELEEDMRGLHGIELRGIITDEIGDTEGFPE